MSRDIPAWPSSGSGDVITSLFPDLRKPEEGEWELKLTLSHPAGGYAKIELMQDVNEDEPLNLVTAVRQISSTPTEYIIPVDGGEAGNYARSRCGLTQLSLQVTHSPCDTSSLGNITGDITIGCIGTVSVTMSWDGVNPNNWIGSAPIPGGGTIAVGLTWCYANTPGAGLSQIVIYDSQGLPCYQSNGITVGVNGTQDPLYLTGTTELEIHPVGGGDCTSLGCQAGDTIGEVYSE